MPGPGAGSARRGAGARRRHHEPNIRRYPAAPSRRRRLPMTLQQRGPFDRLLKSAQSPEPPEPERGPDRAAIYVAGTILGLALLLLILLVPPISILSRGGGDGGSVPSAPGVADAYKATKRTSMPRLPAGLAAASPLFDLAAPADQQGASRITIPLNDKQTEPRSLALYSYVESKWQRVSDVTLVGGGEAARGDVNALPGNVAVLKRTKATLQVAGSMPSGATVSKDAEGALGTLHPLVFIPGNDGSVVGQPPAVPPATYKVVPGIVAPAPDVVDTILRSTELTNAHVQAIAQSVKQGNFEGILIDYPAVNPTLRSQYTSFVASLAKALHDDGRKLTLKLPMPLKSNGDFDTGAYDWEALGQSADTIEMAGELDQELYFQDTEAALDYVTGKVDRTKVLLSINARSIERGGDGLRTMPLDEAMGIASTVAVKTEGDIAPGAKVQLVATNVADSEGASGIHWDDAARSVTFSYPGRGGKRTVWISNSFSAAFRLDLAQRHGLGGISVDDVSEAGGGADIWPAVQQLSDAGSITLSRPNGELFTPAWTTADGSIAPPTGSNVTWTAPATAGSYSITVVVSDGVVREGQAISIDVVAPETGGE